MKPSFNKLTLTVLLGSFISLSSLAADFEFTFQSADQSGTQNFELQKKWTETVAELTNDRISIDLLPAGSVVQYQETLDAVSAGILDGHITEPSYFAGKEPAFGLIANPVGAWSSSYEMLRFMYYGGGNELMQEILTPYGIHFIGASPTGLEGFISKKPLNGVDDLKGLKVRAPEGLVQNVFAAAGAAPVNLPLSEVFTSLDKGVIDAADATVYSTNQSLGMHDIAPHPVYPGFHSLPMIETSMNKDAWDSLPADIQRILEISARDFAYDVVATVDINDRKAVAKDIANPDITVHDWPQEERAKFRAIATKQWAIVAEQSENAKKVYDTLIAYLTDQGLLVE